MKWSTGLLLLLAAAVAVVGVFVYVNARRKRAILGPYLDALSSSESSRSQLKTIGALGREKRLYGYRPAVEALAKLLQDGSSAIRHAALVAINELANGATLTETTVEALMAAADHDADANVRLAAVKILEAWAYHLARVPQFGKGVLGQQAESTESKLNRYIVAGLSGALQDSSSDVRQAAMEALRRIGTPPALAAAEAPMAPRRDAVQFSAFHPPNVHAGREYGLFCYAHLKGDLPGVEEDVRRFREQLGTPRPAYRAARQSAQIERGTEIAVVPECDDLTFDPPSARQAWDGEWLRFGFNFKPPEGLAGESLFVRVSIQVKGIEIAHMKCPIEVSVGPAGAGEAARNSLAAAKLSSQVAEMYRSIFVSYSRKDAEIVEIFRLAQIALGNEVFVDTYSIRAGQDWRAALARAIDKADVFQLFWSEHSSMSEEVRAEVDYAGTARSGGARGDAFIRPVFWSRPMPEPPEALAHLNFKFLPVEDLLRQKPGVANH